MDIYSESVLEEGFLSHKHEWKSGQIIIVHQPRFFLK